MIDWAAETHQCSILCLWPIMNEIFLLKQHFNFVSFTHVYRERNSTIDRLSKEGAQCGRRGNHKNFPKGRGWILP